MWVDHSIIQVNRLPEQFSDRGGTKKSRISIQNSLQIPKLMLNAQLGVLSRGLHLPTESIAHLTSAVRPSLGHQIKDDLSVLLWNNLMLVR